MPYFRVAAMATILAIALTAHPASSSHVRAEHEYPNRPNCGADFTALALPGFGQDNQEPTIQYTERGDPDAEPETITVNLEEAQAAVSRSAAGGGAGRAERGRGRRGRRRGRRISREERGRLKDRMQLANKMADLSLGYARSNPYVGRRTTPEKVLEIVSLWGYNTETVRYCAMGVAYAACRAYAQLEPRVEIPPDGATEALKRILPDILAYYFTPSPSCYLMMQAAQARERTNPGGAGGWVPKGAAIPKRGWLVLFDWIDRTTGRGKGVPQHVGIVLSANGPTPQTISTVEFNTTRKLGGNQSDGGAVAEKTRSMTDIVGYIRTY